jgi:hypothetical protein
LAWDRGAGRKFCFGPRKPAPIILYTSVQEQRGGVPERVNREVEIAWTAATPFLFRFGLARAFPAALPVMDRSIRFLLAAIVVTLAAIAVRLYCVARGFLPAGMKSGAEADKPDGFNQHA